ncbi:Histone-lysine N-methyltransferase SETMAR [Eufriesea mexicana]|uniref:Histone-lysine N-methyltransferase SETMAR n=1 Tax=Eufriesea mexicana TaxID=516756 RepID=A0A310SIP3_9HYME|nr:Histone-lysine N-methyltransferase SETMAR [Eufriesea mexicana]
MESQKVHIRHVMLWKFKQANSAKATTEKICSVYGERLITYRAIRNWFVKFHSGDTISKDELRAGCPSDFDDNLLKAILEQNPRQSIRGQYCLESQSPCIPQLSHYPLLDGLPQGSQMPELYSCQENECVGVEHGDLRKPYSHSVDCKLRMSLQQAVRLAEHRDC